MRYCDVLVVGAGPSGVATALTLLRKGVDVLLIDKCEFPRYKCCGGLVTNKTWSLLQSLKILDIEKVVESEVNKVTLKSKGQRLITVEVDYPLRIVNRKTFDNCLLEAYESEGGRLTLGENVSKYDLERNVAITSKGEIHYGYIVAADGALSRLGDLVRGEKLNMALGVEEILQEPSSEIVIEFNVCNTGYAWEFPRGSQTVKGISSIRHGLEHAKGAFLPYNNVIKRVCGRANIILVGDAAGLTDTITGEGIYYALRSGTIAGEALSSATPLHTYNEMMVDVMNDINGSTRLANHFYKHSELVMKHLPKHPKIVKRVIDYQVSNQCFDYHARNILLNRRTRSVISEDTKDK